MFDDALTDLLQRLDALQRFPLALLPTPLQPLPNLSESVGRSRGMDEAR